MREQFLKNVFSCTHAFEQKKNSSNEICVAIMKTQIEVYKWEISTFEKIDLQK